MTTTCRMGLDSRCDTADAHEPWQESRMSPFPHRGDFRRIRAGIYCIWKETKKWDSLAFRVRPVRTTLFRIQHLFSSDREHCVRGIAICYPLVKSAARHASTGLTLVLIKSFHIIHISSDEYRHTQTPETLWPFLLTAVSNKVEPPDGCF